LYQAVDHTALSVPQTLIDILGQLTTQRSFYLGLIHGDCFCESDQRLRSKRPEWLDDVSAKLSRLSSHLHWWKQSIDLLTGRLVAAQGVRKAVWAVITNTECQKAEDLLIFGTFGTKWKERHVVARPSLLPDESHVPI